MYNIPLKEKPVISDTIDILELVDGAMLDLYKNLNKIEEIIKLLGLNISIKGNQIIVKDEDNNIEESITISLQEDRVWMIVNTAKGILEIDTKLNSESINIKLLSNENIDIQLSDEITSIKISNKKISNTNDIDIYLKCSKNDVEYGIKPSHSRLDMVINKLNVNRKKPINLEDLKIIDYLIDESIPGVNDYIDNKHYGLKNIVEKLNKEKKKVK